MQVNEAHFVSEWMEGQKVDSKFRSFQISRQDKTLLFSGEGGGLKRRLWQLYRPKWLFYDLDADRNKLDGKEGPSIETDAATYKKEQQNFLMKIFSVAERPRSIKYRRMLFMRRRDGAGPIFRASSLFGLFRLSSSQT